ncbi:Serine/threonine-protein kinase Nek7 [Aphelenchoides besseyi]|nr:Serine/threonine-protein kinase Nek7 [Aphelenchoides besseyi]
MTKPNVRINLTKRSTQMYNSSRLDDAATKNDRLRDLKLSDFRDLKKLGRGQFAVCYAAKLRATDEPFALKQIQPSTMKDEKAQQDFDKEINLLHKLKHVNIIRYYTSFYDITAHGRCYYIVLELADAGDLHVLLKQFKKKYRLLPERAIWKYFVQISRGLEYMHSESIMHRDIKPANVFITTNGVAKLGDLGLGRFFSQQTAQAHSIVGTPYYMSPERMNEIGYNFKSDIWSMAALQSPFFAEKMNLYALCRKIERCDYPPIPSNLYSTQLRLLISNCICNDPQMRFSAKQVLEVADRMHSYFSGRSS